MKSTDSSLPTLIQLSSSTSKSNRLYQDCNKLPLDRFIDCLLDNELSQLIIEGTTTEKELSEAWEKIYLESLKLSASTSSNEYFETWKKKDDLRAKITIATNTVKHLEISYDKELVDVLNSLSLKCTVTEEDKGEALISKLNGVIARTKKWIPQLNQLTKELDKLREQNSGKLDRNYFDDILQGMSANYGYHVEASKITVSRFYRSLNKMKEQQDKEEFKQAINAS